MGDFRGILRYLRHLYVDGDRHFGLLRRGRAVALRRQRGGHAGVHDGVRTAVRRVRDGVLYHHYPAVRAHDDYRVVVLRRESGGIPLPRHGGKGQKNFHFDLQNRVYPVGRRIGSHQRGACLGDLRHVQRTDGAAQPDRSRAHERAGRKDQQELFYAQEGRGRGTHALRLPGRELAVYSGRAERFGGTGVVFKSVK